MPLWRTGRAWAAKVKVSAQSYLTLGHLTLGHLTLGHLTLGHLTLGYLTLGYLTLARFRADNTARSDALTVLASMPTPHSVCPPISHST
jgi:hypothetical protein